MSYIKVAFQDFNAPYEELKEELDAAYRRFMESGWFVLGEETKAFEEEYAKYCGATHCVGLSTGLDALHLALRAIGIGASDDVIVPSNTYIATWLAVSQAGATPLPVEPDSATFNIDPDRVKSAMTSNVKAILAVNLYGQPCDYDSLANIADFCGIPLIIDNAQAHGARYKGRPVGGIADIECHSFYPSKNLGAFGEAGAITTNDSKLADKIRVLRNYGSRVRYRNEVQGYNNRIDELQAAFLRVKLRRLDEWNARRSAVAAQYSERLGNLSSKLLNTFGYSLLPTVAPWATSVWHLFVIRHPQRDALQKHLTEHGIQTLIHYPTPPHQSGAYLSRGHGHSHKLYPIAEQMACEVLSLPIGPHLASPDVVAVCHALEAF